MHAKFPPENYVFASGYKSHLFQQASAGITARKRGIINLRVVSWIRKTNQCSAAQKERELNQKEWASEWKMNATDRNQPCILPHIQENSHLSDKSSDNLCKPISPGSFTLKTDWPFHLFTVLFFLSSRSDGILKADKAVLSLKREQFSIIKEQNPRRMDPQIF